ncbi:MULTISPECIES: response regulator transcription factor [unclassified Streptomyces]|uniref:response regulator transcription factor n=1 Tax=unclassified Streptomyces TaxID=2593676 RepID=UPI0036534ED8
MGFGVDGDGSGEIQPRCPYCESDDREEWGRGAEWIRRGFLRIPDLTDRELQVFHAMACGPSNGELAKALGMTVRTVKFHLENMRGKLGGISRVQVCLLAVHHRIPLCPAGRVAGAVR